MKKLSIILLAISALLYSCHDEQDIKTLPSNFVTQKEATIVAEAQAPGILLNNRGRSLGINRIKDVLAVTPDESPSMYIFNYERNGFIIVPADNRVFPVMAYSEENFFPSDKKILPDGLVAWLNALDQNVKAIRADTIKQTLVMKQNWNRYSQSYQLGSKGRENAKGSNYEDCYNGYMYFITDYLAPLLQTNWNQGSGYNNLMTDAGCSQTLNGRYWAGCVATSVAQVMKYHQFPSSFDWSSMPNNSGSFETSRLMSVLGYSYNLDMSYGCSGSGAYHYNVPRTFANLGYPTPSYNSYNYFTVRGDLQQGRPAILGGFRRSVWWIFGSEGGHSWVADGYSHTDIYTCIADPNTPGEYETVVNAYIASLHMNWGWGGQYNGWFSVVNFNPGGVTYNWNPDMITNIRTP
jgi:hypothetical protein